MNRKGYACFISLLIVLIFHWAFLLETNADERNWDILLQADMGTSLVAPVSEIALEYNYWIGSYHKGGAEVLETIRELGPAGAFYLAYQNQNMVIGGHLYLEISRIKLRRSFVVKDTEILQDQNMDMNMYRAGPFFRYYISIFNPNLMPYFETMVGMGYSFIDLSEREVKNLQLCLGLSVGALYMVHPNLGIGFSTEYGHYFPMTKDSLNFDTETGGKVEMDMKYSQGAIGAFLNIAVLF